MLSKSVRLGCHRMRSFASSGISPRVFMAPNLSSGRFSDEAQQARGKKGKEHVQEIYNGAVKSQLTVLKRVSATTCLIGLIGIPLLLINDAGTIPTMGQTAVGGTSMVSAVGTTVMLNTISTPYILKMSEIMTGNSGTHSDSAATSDRPRRFRVERLTFLGGMKTSDFSLDEVKPVPNAMRPFVSFEVGKDPYYVEGFNMRDKELLKVLLGRPLEAKELRNI